MGGNTHVTAAFSEQSSHVRQMAGVLLKSFAFAREAALQIGLLLPKLSMGCLKPLDACCACSTIGEGQQACAFVARRASSDARARCWTSACSDVARREGAVQAAAGHSLH